MTFNIDLKPILNEVALSRRAKNMTEFKKYLKQSERHLEVISLIDKRVSSEILVYFDTESTSGSAQTGYIEWVPCYFRCQKVPDFESSQIVIEP